jgi:uncharacterized protein DUF4302
MSFINQHNRPMNLREFYGKLIPVFLLCLIVFSSCKKEETRVFDQTPDTRINDALTKYGSALTSSAAGWNATIKTGTGGIYHFHFRFNESNRVFMYADINLETASTAKESSYRLKALQTPSLLFDTYSYLHILADPDGGVNGGTYGQGLISDFEFAFDSLATDSILLTGRVNGTKLTLIKATQQDFDAWQNGAWANVLVFENINKIQNYFKRVNIGGVNYDLRVDPVARTITFTWVDGSGNFHEFSSAYNYSSSGVVFVTPFDTGSQTISGFEIVSWNAVNSTLSIKVNGTATTIAGAPQPLKVDAGAPQRWRQYAINNGGLYWISATGFTINGVEDGFGIKTLKTDTSQYFYLLYWPEPNGQTFDALAPTFLIPSQNALDLIYGIAVTPNFSPDGRVVFSYLSDVVGPYPSTGPAALTRSQFLIAQGYYFIQTGPTTYDMVSASDAKAWISWQY